MTAKTVAYIGGATVMLAWLASASGTPRPQRDTAKPPQPARDVALDRVASDVHSQAARLRQRLASAPVPQTPLRNPFTFEARQPAKVHTAVRAAAAPVAVEPILDLLTAEPALTLLGVASKNTPAGVVRTAMIGDAADELLMVAAGEDVAGRYRVVAVGPDAVELKDLLTGATRRLTLK